MKTAEETNGELLQIEYIVDEPEMPFQHIPWHTHQIIEERFEVISGKLGVITSEKTNEQILGVGEEVFIPPGTFHAFWNAGEAELRFIIDVRPPSELQTVWETVFGLAKDGKVNQQGLPNPFQIGVLFPIMDTYFAGPPIAMQKVTFGILGQIGRVLGYCERYRIYSDLCENATDSAV